MIILVAILTSIFLIVATLFITDLQERGLIRTKTLQIALWLGLAGLILGVLTSIYTIILLIV